MGIADTINAMKSDWCVELRYPTANHNFLITLKVASKDAAVDHVKRNFPGAFIKDVYQA